MRMAILILALIGALASLALGMKWVGDYNDNQQLIVQLESLAGQSEQGRAALSELAAVRTAGYLLMAMGLAAVGGVVVAKKQPRVAAGIFGLAVVLPAIFTMKTLLATFFLLIAAVLSFRTTARPT